MHRTLIEVAKIGIIWTAVAFLLFLFLSPTFLALNFFNLDPSFLLVPLLSLIVILFSSNVASIAIERSSRKKVATKWLRILALSVFFFLISKNTIDNASIILPQGYASLFYLSFSFAGGLLGLSLGSLFGLLEDTRDPRISSASKWISEGLTRNFVFGFFLTAYISFVRYPLIELNPYVAIAEWVAVALAVAVVYINVKMVFEEYDPDLENTGWRKHIQEVERETGDDFKHLTFVQEQFVNQGVKEPLLIYLTLLLRDLGKNEKQIIRTMAPLLHYRDKKTSVFALPLVKENLKRRNRESRKEILEDFMAKI
jgi:hypothetical protein